MESYTRDDGTEVRGHWRSRPEGSSDESSTNNNSQKEDITTDEQGSVIGGASEVNDTKTDEVTKGEKSEVETKNTGAVALQTAGVLKNYNILVPIKMDLK